MYLVPFSVTLYNCRHSTTCIFIIKFCFIFIHSFDFCQAATGKSAPAENLGQVVFGERIRPSPYEIFFNKETGKCKTVCTKNYDPASKQDDMVKLDFLKKGMRMNYQHHWIVDNMPVRLYTYILN